MHPARKPMKHLVSAVLYTDTICHKAVPRTFDCFAVGFSLTSLISMSLFVRWRRADSNTNSSATQPSFCGSSRRLEGLI
jgi:hypothetical protein